MVSQITKSCAAKIDNTNYHTKIIKIKVKNLISFQSLFHAVILKLIFIDIGICPLPFPRDWFNRGRGNIQIYI